jgi:hypothetical protein
MNILPIHSSGELIDLAGQKLQMRNSFWGCQYCETVVSTMECEKQLAVVFAEQL